MSQKQAAFRVSKKLSLIFIVCKLHLNLYIYLKKKKVGIHFRLKFASLQAASLLHIRAQVNIKSAFSRWKAFSSSRKTFSYMRKNMPWSSSADILCLTEKAHMRANMSQGKICKKENSDDIAYRRTSKVGVLNCQKTSKWFWKAPEIYQLRFINAE